MDNIDAAEDMQYLKQPRGPGTAYVFRMKTPPALIGQIDPTTGKPFGKEITRGLRTRHLPTAQKLRAVKLGDITRLALGAESDDTKYPIWSLEAAQQVRQSIEEQDRNEFDDDTDEVDIRGFIYDQIEDVQNLPKSKQPPAAVVRRFEAVALRGAYPVERALEEYLKERSEGNPKGLKALSKATVNDLRGSVRYLTEHFGVDVALNDIDHDAVADFLYQHLPSIHTPRSPDGMSPKTISKHRTLIGGIWRWAIQMRRLPRDHLNPWEAPKGIPSGAPKNKSAKRTLFTPEQATKIMEAYPQGDRLGDAFRLLLVTACRADEVARLKVEDVEEDASGFHVVAGKTENATRFIPLIEPAQELLRRRLSDQAKDDRVFPEWPVKPATGKADALPQAFTRARRKVLGSGTDGSLALHSTRHTWRTAARQAHLREADINELGGWAGDRTSNSVYDHGLLKEQLVEAQQKVGEFLEKRGFLNAF